MWHRTKEESQKTRNRTKDELKEALLKVLRQNRGRVLSTEDLIRVLPIKVDEKQAFSEAFQELTSEGKIKQYIGLP